MTKLIVTLFIVLVVIIGMVFILTKQATAPDESLISTSPAAPIAR